MPEGALAPSGTEGFPSGAEGFLSEHAAAPAASATFNTAAAIRLMWASLRGGLSIRSSLAPAVCGLTVDAIVAPLLSHQLFRKRLNQLGRVQFEPVSAETGLSQV